MEMPEEFKKWLATQSGKGIFVPCTSFGEEILALEAWKASRVQLIEELRKLGWAPCVLQEAIDAAGIEPC